MMRFGKLIAAALLLCMSQSQLLAQGNTINDNAIADYFSASLNGDAGAFGHDAEIAADDIASTREKVWALWKDAVLSHPEEKLIELDILANRKSGSWTLPSKLEPNAKMPYYYGCNLYSAINQSKKYPLFVYMHGSGDKAQEWETGINLCTNYFYTPAIYFVPQIPNAYGEYYRWAIQSKQWAWEKLLRLAFVDDHIDHNRIYFFGISEGGYGSQRLASFYADYIAGAGPMAGGEPLKNAPMENVANIAFSLRTGANDGGFGRNILTQKALEVADSLEKAHPGYYKHFIDVIPGYGHAIDYTPTTPWLAKFSRNPHPEYFYFEMYDMYGRKRETFYNLKVNEPSSVSERSCYEVKRDGNTIELNATIVRYTTTYSSGGIEMYFKKKYQNSKKGNVTIYLNEEMVNFSQPVRVLLNGKEVFNGMVGTSLKSMVESCALFYDPERLFTAAIDVDIPSGTAVATSVDAVKEVDDVDVPSGAVYDLTGRRVEEPTRPGIYIKDGKAVLVR